MSPLPPLHNLREGGRRRLFCSYTERKKYLSTRQQKIYNFSLTHTHPKKTFTDGESVTPAFESLTWCGWALTFLSFLALLKMATSGKDV